MHSSMIFIIPGLFESWKVGTTRRKSHGITPSLSRWPLDHCAEFLFHSSDLPVSKVWGGRWFNESHTYRAPGLSNKCLFIPFLSAVGILGHGRFQMSPCSVYALCPQVSAKLQDLILAPTLAGYVNSGITSLNSRLTICKLASKASTQ